MRSYDKRKFPYLWDYRFRLVTAKTKRKLDAIFFNPFDRFIVLDADMFFYKRPDICIKFIDKKTAQKVYYGGRRKSTVNTYFDTMGYEYPLRQLLNAHFHRSMNVSFNDGILLVGNRRLLNMKRLDNIMKFLHEIKYSEYSMANETALFLLWSPLEAKQLSPDEYFMATTVEEFEARDRSHAVAIHYMGDRGLKEKFILDTLKSAFLHNFFQ